MTSSDEPCIHPGSDGLPLPPHSRHADGSCPYRDIPHGTYAGWNQEQTRGLPICRACRAAATAYLRQWRKRRRRAASRGLGWPQN